MAMTDDAFREHAVPTTHMLVERAVAAERSRIYREVVGPLVDALRKAEDTLMAFRSYYISDNRLGLTWQSNAEIKRLDETKDAIWAALSAAREQMQEKR